jgi:cyclic lactone autoinducer peptide
MKFVTFILGVIGLLMDKITTMNSCFWFAYEPNPPQMERGKDDQ